eukprot:TRINITY_DN3007_c0_g1_i4.p1 TRINITY_DN3007_c0_g1~~TRINITY_DN3007_c0_g1_i4.p1  ORF type:complete len:406 (-),score=22.06 TRINITY_DN3007_c0_g1_i4:58-1275(-)
MVIPIPKLIPSPVKKTKTAAPPFVCRYYDVATRSYRTDGCSLLSEDVKYIYCSCTHLTAFTFSFNDEADILPISKQDILTVAQDQLKKDEAARIQSEVPINSPSALLTQISPTKTTQSKAKILLDSQDLLLSFSAVEFIKNSLAAEDNTKKLKKDSNTIEFRVKVRLQRSKWLLGFFLSILIANYIILCFKGKKSLKRSKSLKEHLRSQIHRTSTNVKAKSSILEVLLLGEETLVSSHYSYFSFLRMNTALIAAVSAAGSLLLDNTSTLSNILLCFTIWILENIIRTIIAKGSNNVALKYLSYRNSEESEYLTLVKRRHFWLLIREICQNVSWLIFFITAIVLTNLYGNDDLITVISSILFIWDIIVIPLMLQILTVAFNCFYTVIKWDGFHTCLLYTSPSPRDS